MAWLFQGFAVRGASTDQGRVVSNLRFTGSLTGDVRKAAGHLEDNLTFLKQIGTVFQ
jgi:hypothetical protein